MTAWIFAIREGKEEHLRIALQHGFWDTKYNAVVAKGDAVYFWQSGNSFVAKCVATGDRRPLGAADRSVDRSPWNDRESYRWRFPMQLISANPTRQPKWAGVQRLTGRKLAIRGGWCSVHGTGEEALASFFTV
ncbi:hypothetical protein N864_11740 [Intrasporangium chromatireducens Q5-1]|uniref:EVE domain-containing protein n=1 Tax=Intrasporangium chromatireducens Q5-1 TaxID=584657 RepID=W9GSJ0_9MICO|nr:hypothetical protein [Intrasporangium chromatireducens]EWT07997.1 hypothetical protein N864_11740 [Intrasporangium chromatireducens Q5-1]